MYIKLAAGHTDC